MVVAGAGDLVDGGTPSSVASAHSHQAEPAAMERLVGAGHGALRVDLDDPPVGQRERGRRDEAGDIVAVLAVGSWLAIGSDPGSVVAEVDDGNRLGHVSAGPAAVAVHDRAVRELPVPDAEEPVVELDLPPHPQGAASVVPDAPRVVALADPAVDLVARAVDRVGAGVDAGLEDVGLIPDQLVAGPHGAPAQPVGLGPGPPRQIQADAPVC